MGKRTLPTFSDIFFRKIEFRFIRTQNGRTLIFFLSRSLSTETHTTIRCHKTAICEIDIFLTHHTLHHHMDRQCQHRQLIKIPYFDFGSATTLREKKRSEKKQNENEMKRMNSITNNDWISIFSFRSLILLYFFVFARFFLPINILDISDRGFCGADQSMHMDNRETDKKCVRIKRM